MGYSKFTPAAHILLKIQNNNSKLVFVGTYKFKQNNFDDFNLYIF